MSKFYTEYFEDKGADFVGDFGIMHYNVKFKEDFFPFKKGEELEYFAFDFDEGTWEAGRKGDEEIHERPSLKGKISLSLSTE